VSPAAFLCWSEKICGKQSEHIFLICAHCFAPLPGRPGAYLRRAFYRLTLEKCSPHCHIGFGSFFTHRKVIVEDYVNVGAYTMIGSANLGTRCLIGPRVSILSGKEQHVRDEKGEWSPFSQERMVMIKIGPDTWIGDGTVIMADVGRGCQIGACTVISTPVKDNVLVAGNPARYVKTFENTGYEGE
jgi:acetyltransferase-like isoleucine patch superfamily enzyme